MLLKNGYHYIVCQINLIQLILNSQKTTQYNSSLDKYY